MAEFPERVYGRCPLGGNPAPYSETLGITLVVYEGEPVFYRGSNVVVLTEGGDQTKSPNLIPDGEEQELVWSDYYGTYVCPYHAKTVEDIRHAEEFHDADQSIQKKISAMGFRKTVS